MKKTMMALAAVLASSAAFAADTSATLYGVADVNFGRTSTYSYTGFNPAVTGKNGQVGLFVATRANQMVVDSGGLSDSRIGLRVQEELGNGNMGFVIHEVGVNTDTGTSAGARTSIIGLKSGFGTFTAGRQATPYYDALYALSAQKDSRFDAAKGDPISVEGMIAIASFRSYVNANGGALVNTAAPAYTTALTNALAAANANNLSGSTGAWVGYQERISNSIRYDSPDFNGFTGSATVGLGENRVAGGAKASYNAGFSLNYASGPMALTLAHQTDASQVPAGTIVIPANSLVKLSNTLIGGVYDLGSVKLNAGFNLAKYNIKGVKSQKEVLLGATVPMGTTTLVAQYARSQGDSLDKSHSLGLEAQYALSKRSTAYAGANMTKLPAYKNSAVGFGLRHVF